MSAAIGPGSTFAGYRVESLLGRGGMGVVYRATDLSLERPVALKLIAPELADDGRFRARFLRGAAARRLARSPERDPDLRGRRARRAALPGDALRARERPQDACSSAKGRSARSGRCAILGQIAGALDAAHRRGLVHRDVKPANVLLDEDEHAYLTDFGITKQLGEPRPTPATRPARSTTWPRSRSAASRSTGAPTNTRSRACSTSAWPARRRSGARRRPRRCGRTCRRSRRRCGAPGARSGAARGAGARRRTSAIRPATS